MSVNPCLPLLLLLSSAVAAEPFAIGGDLLAGEDDAMATAPSDRDLFAAGPSVLVNGTVAADAHVAGFSVAVEGATGQDLYAAGGDVEVRAPVGDDLTAMGFSVTVGPEATIGGNARLAGGSVAVEAPIGGALLATGGAVRLDAPVAGDAWIVAESVTFGPDARVEGALHLETSDPVEVPAVVVPPERVTALQLESGAGPSAMPGWAEGWAGDWTGDWRPGTQMMRGWDRPGPLAVSGFSLIVLAFLVALGLGLLAAAPARVEAMRGRAARRPGLAMLVGVLGLSALVGLVPVSAMTVIGLPLVPLVVLAILLAWTLGYLLGAYTLAMGLLDTMRGTAHPHGTGVRIAALALGLLLAALLNFVPVLGWIANLALMLLGLGALTAALAERLALASARSTAPVPAAPSPPPPPAPG